MSAGQGFKGVALRCGCYLRIAIHDHRANNCAVDGATALSLGAYTFLGVRQRQNKPAPLIKMCVGTKLEYQMRGIKRCLYGSISKVLTTM